MTRIIDPDRAILAAIGDKVVARIDNLSRNQIRNEQMFRAGRMLIRKVQHPVMTGAMPTTLNDACMQTGATIYNCRSIRMAHIMVGT